MTITIHERDIVSAVCQRCAECCRIKLTLTNTDSRYRQFLRAVGLHVTPVAGAGATDCCADQHDVKVDLGPCRHLRVRGEQNGATQYACDLHGTDHFPKLCEQYNCVSWAKSRNRYDDANEMLRVAQAALARSAAARDASQESGPAGS